MVAIKILFIISVYIVHSACGLVNEGGVGNFKIFGGSGLTYTGKIRFRSVKSSGMMLKTTNEALTFLLITGKYEGRVKL